MASLFRTPVVAESDESETILSILPSTSHAQADFCPMEVVAATPNMRIARHSLPRSIHFARRLCNWTNSSSHDQLLPQLVKLPQKPPVTMTAQHAARQMSPGLIVSSDWPFQILVSPATISVAVNTKVRH